MNALVACLTFKGNCREAIFFTNRLFNGLSAGGQVYMPMADSFWGSYFGMLTDAFGVQWMVSYEYPKP